jgi:hypothetical protein
MRTISILIVAGLLMGCFSGLSFGSIAQEQKETINDLTGLTQPNIGDFDLSKETDGFFVENKGQWDSNLLFIGKTSFGNIGFGSDSIYFDIRNVEIPEQMNLYIENIPSDQIQDDFENVKISGHVIKYSFRGSNNIIPTGIDPLDHKCNYFYGNEPDKWVRGAQSFRSVVYKNLYDDIDLRYYFNKEGTKYEFILNPGSDPRDIMVEVEGHDSLSIAKDELSLQVSGKDILSDRDLISFYHDDHNDIIDSNFMKIDDNLYSFEFGEHEKDRIVIIDPLVFSTFTGTENIIGPSYTDLDPMSNINLFGYEYSMDIVEPREICHPLKW